MQEEKMNRVVNCAYVIDEEYHIIHYNDAIKNIYPELEIGDICYKKLQGEDVPCKVCPLTTPKREGLLYYNKLKKAWIDCMAAPLNMVKNQTDHVVICHVITEMREDQKEQALRLLQEEGKERNSMTGLYNRETFNLKVDAMLLAARPSEYCMVALDVENFKLYNTLYGFQQGNDFLRYIGYSMKEVFKHVGFSGYMSEDDFAAFLPNREDLLLDLSERLKFYIDSREENTEFYPSMGIYVIEDVTMSAEEIYDRASTARNLLRGNQLSRMIWYDESMIRDMEENYKQLNDLKRGLKQGEFVIYLQPKCNMRNGKLVGMEALCRWNHPKKGVLGPGQFIPTMESNGLITSLDLQIWEKTCAFIKRWLEEKKKMVPISINVSRIDFRELNVVETMEHLVKQYDIPKKYLEIEVTESAYAENEMIVKGAIDKLRESGFVVAMDDFGSGYSSLNMLQSVSVDILKLDMRFLRFAEEPEKRGIRILEMIVHLANTLNIKMIAEGVETETQRDLLLRMGCEYAQGFFYYHPMAVEAIEGLLESAEVEELKQNKIQQEAYRDANEMNRAELITQLSGLSSKYSESRKTMELYEILMKDFIHTKIELDYKNYSSDAVVNHVIAFMRKQWKLSFEAREKIKRILNPEELHKKEKGEVRKENLFTEDNRELILYILILGQKKAMLCIQDQGKIPFEKVMMQHPLLWSYDYDVYLDHLQIVSREDAKDVETVEISDFRKKVQRQGYLNGKEFSKLKNELSKALKYATSGVIEYESSISDEEKIWKRLYYLSLANHKGKVYRVVAMEGNIEKEHQNVEVLMNRANLDQMTGFLNHDIALDFMEESLIAAKGGTLMSVDIDNFKDINDTVGHSQGDECIRRLAELLRKTFRDHDLYGRVGGDEFLVFMPGITQSDVAKRRVQEFFAGLKSIQIPRVKELKCSVGIVSTNQTRLTMANLLKQVDYALYEAKNAGKGHFVSIENGHAVHHHVQNEVIHFEKEKDRKAKREFIGELFMQLYDAQTKEEGMNSALAYIGEKLDVSRVYIFEFDTEGKYARNTYEWCAQGIVPEIDNLQKVTFEELGFDLNRHYEDDLWFCPDVSMLEEKGMRELLEEQNIKGMLHWLFRKKGHLQGMIGFDECRENIIWSTQYADVLKRAGEVLSKYLMAED